MTADKRSEDKTPLLALPWRSANAQLKPLIRGLKQKIAFFRRFFCRGRIGNSAAKSLPAGAGRGAICTPPARASDGFPGRSGLRRQIVTGTKHSHFKHTEALRNALISFAKPSARIAEVQAPKSAKSSLEDMPGGDHFQGVQNERNTQMVKNTVIALVAAASLFGAAAPAMAGAFGDGDADSRAFVSEIILTGLHDKGINATSVEEWGDLVRAYVVQADGTEKMELFTPVQLQPVTL